MMLFKYRSQLFNMKYAGYVFPFLPDVNCYIVGFISTQIDMNKTEMETKLLE